MENRRSMKSQLQLCASELLHLHPNDQRLEKTIDGIEKKWLHLVGLMPDNAEQLPSDHMTPLLPSEQLLKELDSWLDEAEAIIEEASSSLPFQYEDVQELLRRYRVIIS